MGGRGTAVRAGFLTALLLLSGCGVRGDGVRAQQPAPRVVPGSAVRAGDEIATGRRTAITRAVETVSPAVVGVNVTAVEQVRSPFADDPFFGQFFRAQPQSREVKSLGSGFIISADGYILTNDHVVGNASDIVVTLTDRRELKATLVGDDPTSDIALLKIESPTPLPYLKLGNSDSSLVGEWVIALGNPFGLFALTDQPTVTVGVLSAIGLDFPPQQDGKVYKGMLQTDAAINSGNSGGPLVNAVGEVVGMNTFIYTGGGAGSIGLGFAIPANRIAGIVRDLKATGRIDRDFDPGFTVQTVDAQIARYFRLDKAEGAIVREVVPRSAAETAGIKPGDIVVGANGTPIRTADDLVAIVRDARVGDLLTLTLRRDGQQRTAKLTLTKATR